MSVPVPTADFPASPPGSRNTGEILDDFARWMGLDPKNLPDPDLLPPWTDEEAAEFKRLIYEACKQVDDPPRQ